MAKNATSAKLVEDMILLLMEIEEQTKRLKKVFDLIEKKKQLLKMGCHG